MLTRSCPACFHPNSEPGFVLRDRFFRWVEGSFVYRKCSGCGSLFVCPPPSRDQLLSYYPKSYWWETESPSSSWTTKLEGLYRSLVVRDHLRFLDGLPVCHASGQPLALIDYGCGSGAFLKEARHRGYQVAGMDVSLAAIENLKRLGIPGFQVASLAAGTVETKFDILTLFHVVEHFAEPRQELLSVLKLAHSGSWVILQIPLLDSLQSQLFQSRWYGLDPPRHLTQFTLQGLLQLLQSVGLQVEKTWHFSLRDNAPAIASSLFPRLDPMGRRVVRNSHPHGNHARWQALSNLIYFALVVAVTPLALLEAALGKGGTLIVRARLSG